MLLDATESQLVLVDYQERLMPAIFEGPAVLANARRLAEVARMLDVVWVVTDACGSRTERTRDAAFDRLAGAGAELVTTEMVAFEWLGTCEHPAFKDVLGLIK